MHPLSHRLLSTLITLTLIALLAGCSKPVGTVSGKVTYAGKTLKGGNVVFVNTEGGTSFSAGINEDGIYKVPNIQGGNYKVLVETDSLKPQLDITMMGPKGTGPVIPKGAKFGPPPGAEVPEGYQPSDPSALAVATTAKRYMKIPDQYKDKETTPLSYTFTGGNQTFDIDLK